MLLSKQIRAATISRKTPNRLAAILFALAITTINLAYADEMIIDGLRLQDFPPPEAIWDGSTNGSTDELVRQSALLWGLHQLKKGRVAPAHLSPLPENVDNADAWEQSARKINALLKMKYSWVKIEISEEILGITDAMLLPYGDAPEEAYALRTFFPDLYRLYIEKNR